MCLVECGNALVWRRPNYVTVENWEFVPMFLLFHSSGSLNDLEGENFFDRNK